MKFFIKAFLALLLAFILSTAASSQPRANGIQDAGAISLPAPLIKPVPAKKPIKQPETKPAEPLQPVPVAVPAPVPQAPAPAAYSGSLSDWLLKLRMCESGGNYAINTGNGFYGAYQFTISTWNSLNTGYSRADLAPPAVQDQAIIDNTNRSSGGLATQNPGCYQKEGLSAFPPA